jgi:histone-lysine N-methyltransferase SETD2
MTPWNTTFTSNYCFLKDETEDDYLWALNAMKETFRVHPKVIVTDHEKALINAIENIFPDAKHILCSWHVYNCVLTHAAREFGSTEAEPTKQFLKEWSALVSITSPDEFESGWTQMQNKWTDTAAGRRVTAYIEKQWLPLKSRFVKAWTNNILHLGNHTSARGEGAHGALKRYLGGSTGNLYIVFERMEQALKEQHSAISKKLSDERIMVPVRLRIPFFEGVTRKVSSYALGLVYEQYLKALRYLKAKEVLPNCTHFHTQAIGIPCAHRIISRLPQPKADAPDEIDPGFPLTQEDFIQH